LWRDFKTLADNFGPGALTNNFEARGGADDIGLGAGTTVKILELL